MEGSALSLRVFSAAGALADGNLRRADKTAGEGAGGTKEIQPHRGAIHDPTK